MRRIAPLALLILCLPNANAQNSAPIKQNPVPIRVEKIPAVPVIGPSLTDKASSSLVAEMMPFVAPLVFETHEITSALVLANASTATTTATITLFSVDGKKSNSQTLTLAPHEKKEVPISSPQDSADQNARWGSVTVEQDPHSMGVVVAGQVIVTDQRASTPAYIDEEFAMPEMEGSTSLSAVTDQSEGPPMVGITNISATLQHISITCIRNGKSPMVSSIAIAAHATTTAKPCSNTSPTTLADYISSVEDEHAQGVYGIKLSGDGAPGSFAAFALAPHHRGRDLVFSSVPFYDPETIHSSDVVFAGVPIGAQETLPAGVYIPRLSLANFSESPLTFSIQLADTVTSPVKDADGNSHQPLVNVLYTGTIPSHQTGEYVFGGQEAQSGLLHSVIVTTEAKPGTYQAKLVSRSTGTLYQVELLAKETREMNNAGVHPWTLEGDSESHIVLFNHNKNNAKVGIFISSGTATVWASEIVLAPSETREISINQLQSEQVPDDHGKRIPLAAKEGVADWRTPDSGQLTGRLMVTSHDHAMARNFSCGTYYGVCELYFYTYYENIAVGGELPMYGASAEYCNFNPNAQNRCGLGTPMSGTVNYYWSVGATNIIALSSSSTIAEPTLQGISAGSGYADVEAEAGSCVADGGGSPTVVPSVTFASVSDLPQGGSETVALSFSNNLTTSPVPIIVTLTTTTGTGAAIFTSGGTIAPGGASTSITTPTILTIKGVTASSVAANIKLNAAAEGSGTPSIATNPQTLTVVSVSLSLQTSGSPTVSNVNYPSSSLGVQVINGFPPGSTGCVGGFQVTGQITPSNYTNVYLRKLIVNGDTYEDPGAVVQSSYANQDDTSISDLELLKSGNIYELDAPTNEISSTFSVGNSVRFRANFDEYAVLGNSTSITKVSTQDLLFFVRDSCIKNSSTSVTLDNTYSGDNQIGTGSTNISDNLQ